MSSENGLREKRSSENGQSENCSMVNGASENGISENGSSENIVIGGCSHIMSANFGGFQTPLPPCQQSPASGFGPLKYALFWDSTF